MKQNVHVIVGIALLATLGVAGLLGCESSDPTAQKDYVITLVASPTTVVLDSDGDATTTLIATVYDANGQTKSGIGVRFAASTGTLQSNGQIISTDGRGEARDTLTVSDDSTVTLTSGSQTKTVEVKIEGGPNQPPTAVITLSPSAGTARKGTAVSFSGSQSEDADGNIVKYRWVLDSTDPAPGQEDPEIIETASLAITRTYNSEQIIWAELTVTDDRGATNTKGGESMTILANIAPKANAGPDTTGTIGSTSPYRCAVTLSAAQSADQDGPACLNCAIAGYEWLWDDGGRSFIVDSPAAQHTYLQPCPETGCNVTLTVWDNGEDGTCPALTPTSEPSDCSTRKLHTDTVKVFCPAPAS